MKHKLLSILLCLAMALSLLPTAALADEATGTGTIKVGGTSYNSFSDAVDAATLGESGVITYEISGKVNVTATGWVQVAKTGLTTLTKVEFIGKTEDAEICITGGVAILADKSYDIDVSFENLILSKQNPTYANDYGHSTKYFTCWLRNTNAGENTVTYTNCTFPNGVCNNQYGKTVFNNCQFTNSANYNLWNYGGNTEVKNSAFSGVRGIKTYNEGTLAVAPTVKIEQTTFSGLTEKAAIVASKATDITLTNVTATGCIKGLLQKDIEDSTDEQKVTIEANGTGISGDFNITAEMDAEAAKNEFNITAGTFPGGINNDYLAPGANFDATTGEVKMSYVAKIDDTEYPTLADAFAAADKTGDTVIELLDDINMTGKSWTPVSVDGNHGQGVITLTGNGKTITGLSAPLFAGGFAGKSGIVINNLTLENVNLNDTGSEYAGTGFGAFICAVDSMPTISLTNCHVKGGTIESTSGARVGGLIGWTSGYNKPTDGPVDTKVTLTNCSVENVTIEAKGSVGGLIGHAGANPATYHTITGCTVKDSTLTCTETGKSWRVGDLVGTANDGQITVDAATSASQNTLTQENADPQKPKDSIFGRKEVGTAGLVIIDNKVVAAGSAYGDIVNKNANEVLVEVSKGHWMKPNEDTVAMIGAKEYTTLTAAINEANTGDTVTLLKDTKEDITIPSGKTITLDLNGKTLTNVDDHTILNNGNLTITGTGRVDNISHAKGALYNKGTVVINGGTFDRSKENGKTSNDSGSNSWYTIKNVGSMTIHDGATVQTAGNNAALGKFSSLVSNGYFDANDYSTNKGLDQPILTIDGGTFRGGLNTIKNDDRAKLTINGGTFSNYYQAVVQNHNIAEITGGTFTAASDANAETYGIYNCGCGAEIDLGTLTVSGGTFTGATYAVAEVSSLNAAVNISGGQFAGTKAAIVKSSTSKATIAVSGGTFSSDPSVHVVGNGNTNIVKRAGSEGAYTYTVLAKSGLTSGVYLTNPSGALASNYYVSSTANGVWTVSYSAPYSGGSSSYDPTYSVSTPSKTEHGTVTVSPKNASKGDTVTVTVKPDSGYVLETLTVTDKNGNELTLKDKGNGKYTFTMPAGKVEVKATFMEDNSMLNFFYDVPNNAYFYEAVKWAVKNGITTGVGNDLFAPEQPCTRAQIVTFLWRAAGSPEPKAMSSFSDVSADSYYAKAVAWAVENGITTGTGDGKFSPDATCTRAQSVTFLFRAIGKLVDSKAEFSDVLTDSYYANAVAWAVENGVTNGIGNGLFGPDNSCTRAQIVTFLFRAYQGK